MRTHYREHEQFEPDPHLSFPQPISYHLYGTPQSVYWSGDANPARANGINGKSLLFSLNGDFAFLSTLETTGKFQHSIWLTYNSRLRSWALRFAFIRRGSRTRADRATALVTQAQRPLWTRFAKWTTGQAHPRIRDDEPPAEVLVSSVEKAQRPAPPSIRKTAGVVAKRGSGDRTGRGDAPELREPQR